jgi:hypothetical protein
MRSWRLRPRLRLRVDNRLDADPTALDIILSFGQLAVSSRSALPPKSFHCAS